MEIDSWKSLPVSEEDLDCVILSEEQREELSFINKESQEYSEEVIKMKKRMKSLIIEDEGREAWDQIVETKRREDEKEEELRRKEYRESIHPSSGIEADDESRPDHVPSSDDSSLEEKPNFDNPFKVDKKSSPKDFDYESDELEMSKKWKKLRKERRNKKIQKKNKNEKRDSIIELKILGLEPIVGNLETPGVNEEEIGSENIWNDEEDPSRNDYLLKNIDDNSEASWGEEVENIFTPEDQASQWTPPGDLVAHSSSSENEIMEAEDEIKGQPWREGDYEEIAKQHESPDPQRFKNKSSKLRLEDIIQEKEPKKTIYCNSKMADIVLNEIIKGEVTRDSLALQNSELFQNYRIEFPWDPEIWYWSLFNNQEGFQWCMKSDFHVFANHIMFMYWNGAISMAIKEPLEPSKNNFQTVSEIPVPYIPKSLTPFDSLRSNEVVNDERISEIEDILELDLVFNPTSHHSMILKGYMQSFRHARICEGNLLRGIKIPVPITQEEKQIHKAWDPFRLMINSLSFALLTLVSKVVYDCNFEENEIKQFDICFIAKQWIERTNRLERWNDSNNPYQEIWDVLTIILRSCFLQMQVKSKDKDTRIDLEKNIQDIKMINLSIITSMTLIVVSLSKEEKKSANFTGKLIVNVICDYLKRLHTEKWISYDLFNNARIESYIDETDMKKTFKYKRMSGSINETFSKLWQEFMRLYKQNQAEILFKTSPIVFTILMDSLNKLDDGFKTYEDKFKTLIEVACKITLNHENQEQKPETIDMYICSIYSILIKYDTMASLDVFNEAKGRYNFTSEVLPLDIININRFMGPAMIEMDEESFKKGT